MNKTYYVVGFLLSEWGGFTHVALIRKNRPDWMAGKWNGIGGKVEAGERSEDAMRREFREEAGVDIDSWSLFLVADSAEEVIHFYVAYTDMDTFRSLDSMTDEEVRAFRVEQACDDDFACVPNLKWEVHMALVAHTFQGVMRLTYPMALG